MRQAKLFVLASTNRHKLEEFLEIAKHNDFANSIQLNIVPIEPLIRNSKKLGLVETSELYLENAIAKARACNHGCHYPSMADDSGLEVLALEGKPGSRSHRYATPKTNQTQDEANIQKLLEELKNKPQDQRKARFVCHLALVTEGSLVYSEGVLEGKIIESPRGKDGFGYDPIFVPEGYDKTLAELGAEEKNKISHRAKAFHTLMQKIKEQHFELAKP